MLIWADDDENQVGLHTNFKLSASGEELFLLNPQGELLDQMFYTNQTSDISYARSPNGFGNFEPLAPTPLATNDQTLSVQKNIVGENDFAVYPNPTSSIINISCDNNMPETIQVYNMQGRLVHQTSNSFHANISHLRSGLYIIKYGSYSGKFLKL